MAQLPFDIPQSLASYYEYFQKEPDSAVERLKKQLKKRGPDAVGHFLLAWLYHLQDRNELAVEESLKAKNLAPGSPFLEKLHYYLSHPQLFDAWAPEQEYSVAKSTQPFTTEGEPVLENLDGLIEKLSKVESKKISVPDKQQEESQKSSFQPVDTVDDIVSETLAKIHEQQGKTEKAIQAYRRLKHIREEKTEYYDKQIARLIKLKNQQDNEE